MPCWTRDSCSPGYNVCVFCGVEPSTPRFFLQHRASANHSILGPALKRQSRTATPRARQAHLETGVARTRDHIDRHMMFPHDSQSRIQAGRSGSRLEPEKDARESLRSCAHSLAATCCSSTLNDSGVTRATPEYGLSSVMMRKRLKARIPAKAAVMAACEEMLSCPNK
jgi:hypothetical protein